CCVPGQRKGHRAHRVSRRSEFGGTSDLGAAGFSAGAERSIRMIPSDREIKLALQRDFIRITPTPSNKAISSTSVDLTLHEEISLWLPQQSETVAPVVVYPARPHFDEPGLLDKHGTKLLLSPEGFILKPGAFVLGWTQEQIRLPHTSRLAGRVEG